MSVLNQLYKDIRHAPIGSLVELFDTDAISMWYVSEQDEHKSLSEQYGGAWKSATIINAVAMLVARDVTTEIGGVTYCKFLSPTVGIVVARFFNNCCYDDFVKVINTSSTLP